MNGVNYYHYYIVVIITTANNCYQVGEGQFW